MVRLAIPKETASSGMVVQGSAANISRIFPDTFPDTFPDIFPHTFPDTFPAPSSTTWTGTAILVTSSTDWS